MKTQMRLVWIPVMVCAVFVSCEKKGACNSCHGSSTGALYSN